MVDVVEEFTVPVDIPAAVPVATAIAPAVPPMMAPTLPHSRALFWPELAKLPADQDWCDVLDTYEERAGILEVDLEIYRPDAEALARREAING